MSSNLFILISLLAGLVIKGGDDREVFVESGQAGFDVQVGLFGFFDVSA
jgi:hypothetical protein